MFETDFFNINDLTVLSAGLLAFVLCCLLLARRRGHEVRNLLLAGFFLQSTLYSIDTLLYWNRNINALVSGWSPNFFFVLGFTFFIQGPLLLWGTQATIRRNFRLRRLDALHLLPVLAYPVFIYAIYLRFDTAYKLRLVHDWDAVKAAPYSMGLLRTQTAVIFIYSLLALRALRGYGRHLAQSGGHTFRVNIGWLKLLVYGFTFICGWHIFIMVSSATFLPGRGYAMGTMENYFRCFLMFGLFVGILRESEAFPPVSPEYAIGSPPPADTDELYLQKLRALMETDKPYLEPNINLERLAARLEMSPKMLSGVINRKLNQNFFEMVRSYRIEEAKERLRDESFRLQTISEIMQMCGFNSKSVFNQTFKERYGVTPSVYRRQHLG